MADFFSAIGDAAINVATLGHCTGTGCSSGLKSGLGTAAINAVQGIVSGGGGGGAAAPAATTAAGPA